ncbi:MAG: Cas8a1 family CRISPR/Cas system-associated protein [Clostridia bacterium]
MTYIQGVIADMSRKKSVFWGNSPDTFVCPLCNMIYSFMPLGFTGIGGRALVFVNANDSVELMRQLNEIVVPEDEKDVYKVTYNSIIKKLVDIKSLHLNKMQVISKDVDNHYKISDISKDKLEIIKKGQKELQSLSYAKQGDNYINIYGEVIDNIISGKNQFSTLDLLLSLEFKYSYQLFNILKLEIYKSQLYKEEVMENKVKIAYVAKGKGEELKRKFGIEADNKLRGFAYQLLNAAHSDNNELFLDRIVRMYVGMQLPIPDIFINGFKGTEEFKTIAYAYIIGLKGEEYIKSEGKTNE